MQYAETLEWVEYCSRQISRVVIVSSNFLFLSESDIAYILTRWLVHEGHEKTNTDILKYKLIILKIFQLLLSSNKVSTSAKQKIRLKTVGYDSVCTLLSKQAKSRDVVVALLKLALSPEQTALKGVDVYMHYEVILAILSIVRTMSLPIKLEIALKVSLEWNDITLLYPCSIDVLCFVQRPEDHVVFALHDVFCFSSAEKIVYTML